MGRRRSIIISYNSAEIVLTGVLMSIIKARIIYWKIFSAAFLPLLLFCLPACQTQAARRAELKKQGEEAISAADLRAFCPPVEFAEGGYAYNIYAGRAIAWQAAIADITRDCRYDRDKGLILIHIAAAGRVVAAAGTGRASLNLPIAIKIARGDQVLFARLYQQRVTPAQANAATQFLFSEKAAVKIAEAVKGTKITIGFAVPERPPARPKAEPDKKPGERLPRHDRLSPKTGDIIIPESF
ncbi:MAG: hypothetical protein DU429_03820 [Candidatus Tokpelaia sp.]|nr:MAG: hypothetical protein DU430_07615 [Candidatus Tokpelaia sp.]KAA6207224.1 MAG: hypothetical protein DU429_03820 [Candidatus Tokpelaia sp.]